MGDHKHHAIIVTGHHSEEHFLAAWNHADWIFRDIPPVSRTACNGIASFFIPPDGGYDGGDESKRCDAKREEFIDYLRQNNEWLEWVEISYGDRVSGIYADIYAHGDGG